MTPSRSARILAALAAALLAAGEGCARQAPPPQAVIRTEPMRPPLDVEARRALVGREIGWFVCPAVPDPVRDLFTEGFYTDADSSRLSAEAYARHQEAVRPLAGFEAQLTALGDAFVRSRPAAPSPGWRPGPARGRSSGAYRSRGGTTGCGP